VLGLKRRTFLEAAAFSGSACLSLPAFAQGDRLRIGLTAVILADQAAFLTRWADYLSKRVGTKVEFAARDSYQAILDPLFAGQLDAAWICGYPYVRFQPLLRLLAVPLYEGRPQYQSYLIRSRARLEQGALIGGWSDLRGKVFAYSDPLSNSGWLVAQGQLAAAGIGPRDLKRAFFAHGHRNVAEAVGAGLALAGSIDGYVWETMRQQRMSATRLTEVIWKSQLHGFPPLVVPARSRHPRIDQLQATLLAMASEEAGRPLLKALNLDGFVAGNPGMFESIRKLAQSVPGSGISA
jgi:phosphonate transport system substrate-binding protein